MSVNVGDAQSFGKKIGDKGNMNICPRTKTYNEKVGGIIMGALVALAAFVIFFNKISDFLLTDLKAEQRNSGNDRINHNNHHIQRNEYPRGQFRK